MIGFACDSCERYRGVIVIDIIRRGGGGGDIIDHPVVVIVVVGWHHWRVVDIGHRDVVVGQLVELRFSASFLLLLFVIC
jgi:hypothetical protein